VLLNKNVVEDAGMGRGMTNGLTDVDVMCQLKFVLYLLQNTCIP
jgi:hypothetical protein